MTLNDFLNWKQLQSSLNWMEGFSLEFRFILDCLTGRGSSCKVPPFSLVTSWWFMTPGNPYFHGYPTNHIIRLHKQFSARISEPYGVPITSNILDHMASTENNQSRNSRRKRTCHCLSEIDRVKYHIKCNAHWTDAANLMNKQIQWYYFNSSNDLTEIAL
jgi:hypothetical protein